MQGATYSHVKKLVECVKKMHRSCIAFETVDGMNHTLAYDEDNKVWNVRVQTAHGDEHVDTTRRFRSYLRRLDPIHRITICDASTSLLR